MDKLNTVGLQDEKEVTVEEVVKGSSMWQILFGDKVPEHLVLETTDARPTS